MSGVFFKGRYILFLKDSCPMMFELLLDVMDRFLNLRDRHSNHRIGAHTCTNHTVPYGTALLGWALFQALVPGYDRTVPPGLRAYHAYEPEAVMPSSMR